MSDLLLFEIKEAPGVPLNDVLEVSYYVAALEHGLSRCKEGFPLSNRLIGEIHEVLLREGRGSEKSPGEFRRSQNWIGGTRPGNAIFVPPLPDRVPDAIEMAENAVSTARRLAEMVSRDRSRIQQLGRVAGSALQVHQSLQTRPITTLTSLVNKTNLTMPTITKAVQALVDEGIVNEITGRRRGRIYSYREYMDIMNEGTALQ